jgi:CelD/BcsL family acetyltransferase involved in cellulose biosynthesis
VEYRLHRGPDALSDVAPFWDQLEKRAPAHPYQRADFARIWCDTIGRAVRATPLIVTLEHDGAPVGLFPACLVRHGPARLLTWLGGPDQVDCGDILFDPAASPADAREFVRESLRLVAPHARGAFVYLTNVRTDAAAFPGLEAELREFKRSSQPYIPLVGSLDDLVAGLTKRHRQKVVHSLKWIEAIGPCTLRWPDRGSPEIHAAVDHLVTLKRARFNRPDHKTNLFNPAYVGFLHETASRDTTFVVAELLCEGKVAAIMMAYVFQGRMYGIQTAYEEEFAHCSPGRVLTYHILKHCFESGIEVYDLGWGNERWKYEWTDLEVPLATFVDRGVGGSALSHLVNVRRQATRLFAAQTTVQGPVR